MSERQAEWIDWEGYGPLWQPGFTAWKSGRITERDAALVLTDGEPTPLSQWTADDVRSYVDSHEGDLQGFTDMAATYVRQEVDAVTYDVDMPRRTVTQRHEIVTTLPRIDWADPEAAMTAEADAFSDYFEDVDA